MKNFLFIAASLLVTPLIVSLFLAPKINAAQNCPVNNSCCSQNLETCTTNGKDSTCPAGFQWCYGGFCVNDNFNPASNTCPQTLPDTQVNCPVNNSCCSQPLQKCNSNGKDQSCPSGFQWCYSGYCVRENYKPNLNSCSDSTPFPSATPSPTPIPSLSPVPIPSPSCPVNDSCCSKPLQRCTANGKDSTCPTGFQWCYAGFCVDEEYKVLTDTCLSPTPSPLPTLRPIPTPTPLPSPSPPVQPVYNQPLGCPVSGRITVPYGYNIFGYSGNNAGCTGLSGCHNGIDIAANSGTVITSTLDGIVTASTWDAYKGNYITVTNSVTNISAVYEHMNSLPILKLGDRVKRGQVLGFVGRTGLGVTGSHVHYKLLRGNSLLNPFRFLKVTNPDRLLLMVSDSLINNNYRNLRPLNSSSWGLCIK